jgi:multiple antibiotic resistance protein
VFLLVYAGLFPIVNPIGDAPIFLGLTRHCTDGERRALGQQAGISGATKRMGLVYKSLHGKSFGRME